MTKPYIITMCSGKGGTGKSVITANLAHHLAKKGKKCLVWDADSMFPNQHLIFGVEPPYRLSEVYSKKLDLMYVVYKINSNLDLLADQPSAGLVAEYGQTPLLNAFEQFPDNLDYDYIIFDTAAGAGDMVMQSCLLADEILMMLTDEPASLIDAYGLIKILRMNGLDDKIKTIINNVIDEEDAEDMNNKLSAATRHFLAVEYPLLGHVEYHQLVRKSIISQQLISEMETDNIITTQIEKLADRIIGN